MSEQSKHHKVSLLLYKLANIVSITTRSNIPALCCGKWRRPTQWKTASLPSPEKNLHLNHENISKGATNQGVEWLELIEFFNSINNLCPNFSFVIQSRRISKKAFETKKKIVLTEKKEKNAKNKIVLTESFLWFAEIVLCATVALGRKNHDYISKRAYFPARKKEICCSGKIDHG